MSLNRAMQLRRERAKLIKGDAQAIIDKAEAESRDMTTEEHQEFDRIMKSSDSKLAEAEKLERLHDEQEALSDSLGTRTPAETSTPADNAEEKEKAYNSAFKQWLRFGKDGLSSQNRAILNARRDENRALVVGTPAAGGYTVPSDNRLMNSLVTAMLAFGGMAEVSRIIETDGGNPLPIPLGDDAMNKAVIIGEAGDHSGGAEPEFNQVILGAFMYSSKVVTCSIELLQDNSVDIEDWLGGRLGERIGRGTNEHFTVGAGTTEPVGVTTCPLGKEAAAGQLTSLIYEDLVDLEHSVDRAYRGNARYMAHDLTIAALKKMKDGDNRPLWVPGIAQRAPDTILGYPFTVNNDMPTMAASAVSLLFGDFRYYYIRQVRNITLVRFDELYMANGQVGFLVLSRQDGALVDPGAAAGTPTYASSPIKHLAHPAI